MPQFSPQQCQVKKSKSTELETTSTEICALLRRFDQESFFIQYVEGSAWKRKPQFQGFVSFNSTKTSFKMALILWYNFRGRYSNNLHYFIITISNRMTKRNTSTTLQKVHKCFLLGNDKGENLTTLVQIMSPSGTPNQDKINPKENINLFFSPMNFFFSLLHTCLSESLYK